MDKYSPDLNPIEFSLKNLKRELNGILDFDEMIERSRSIGLELFARVSTVIQDSG